MDTVTVDQSVQHDTHHDGHGGSNKTVLIGAALIVLVVVVAAVIVVMKVLGSQQTTSNSVIGYATEAQVILDQASLDAASAQAQENAKNGSVALSYKDNAYSTDGVNFECYILNSERNLYDMYLTIYADADMTDELFLSQLIPPGSGFESITLEHSLDLGDHVVYVLVTQVGANDDTGEEEIKNQVAHTMDFHVTEG